MIQIKKYIPLAMLIILISTGCGKSVIEVSTVNETNSSQINSHFYNIGTWTPKASLSKEKEDFAMVELDGKIYVIGGDSGNTWFAENEAYDIEKDTWEVKSPMNQFRSGVAASVIDSKIYVAGGFNGTNESWLNTLEVYDPVSDKWESKSAMITPRSGLGIAVLNKKLYAVGGNLSKKDFLDKLEVYDPSDDSWKSLAPLKISKTEVAVCAAKYLDSQRLFVFGGANDTGIISAAEEYNPATNTWRTRASMTTARANAEVAVFENNIFVMGGRDKNNNKLDVVEVFNTETNQWVTGNKLSSVKAGFGAVTVTTKDNKNLIYTVGGLGKSITKTVEFTPVSKR